MKTLVIFDSNFGNTKRIAEAIAEEFGDSAKAVSVSKFSIKYLEDVSLLIVGSPIIGWRPSEKMAKFLGEFSKGQLKEIKSVSFDTRVNIFFHGDAAKKISKKLEEAGAKIITEPQVFFVKGKKGPLLEGEIEKAKKWVESIKLRL
jgi:flavodoxin